MKANCTVCISTIQWDISPEPVTQEAPASYRKVNGVWNVCYHTPSDNPQLPDHTRTLLSFDGSFIDIRRSGAINGSIQYTSGKKTKTVMDLGFSNICIENDTFSICSGSSESLAPFTLNDCEDTAILFISVEYGLYLNGEYISRCTTTITLKPLRA